MGFNVEDNQNLTFTINFKVKQATIECEEKCLQGLIYNFIANNLTFYSNDFKAMLLIYNLYQFQNKIITHKSNKQ